MPRRTQAESDRTAEAVLTAGVVLFGELGFATTRLEDVARRAGVTRGAVYHHFVSKHRLFEAVVERVQSEVGRAVASAADEADADPWQSLVVGCRTFVEVSVDDAHRRILLVDAPAVLGWETWRAQDADHSARHLRDALDEAAADGLLRVDPTAAAALLSGAMNEAALWVAQEGTAEALQQVLSTLEVLLGSLRAEA